MAKDSKNKKHFFKDFKAELKKVIWPTPKQVVNNTVAVITVVLITAAIVFVLDLTFDLFNKYGVNKLKTKMSQSQSIDTETTENIIDETTTDENVVAEESNEIAE